jgi:hypothetical protein
MFVSLIFKKCYNENSIFVKNKYGGFPSHKELFLLFKRVTYIGFKLFHPEKRTSG